MGSFFIFIATAFISFNSAWALEFDKASFLKQGLSMVEQSIEDRVLEGRTSDAKCPASGTETIDNLGEQKGSLFSALETVQQIMESVKPAVHQKRSDTQKCGSCRQENVVSYVASISPEKVSPIAQCEGRGAETFAMDLQDREDIKDITEQILSGKNNEGKRLQQACPDPCSYYVTTAETKLANGKTHLTLTVQCGQPREGSVFSANYEFKAGMIHQWTCHN